MSFLLTNQRCQRTEGNSKHWPQPRKLTDNLPHAYLIHQVNTDAKHAVLSLCQQGTVTMTLFTIQKYTPNFPTRLDKKLAWIHSMNTSQCRVLQVL